jgi:sulfide:quinone oxidoreductase
MANKMRKALSGKDWSVTVVEKELNHYYQPGFLFIPFGYYQKKNIQKPTLKFFSKRIEVIKNEIEKIDPVQNRITLIDGTEINYNVLIIAIGTRISPKDTPGLKGELWQKNVFDFYTIEGAEDLSEHVSGILTIGEFYAHAGGEGSQIIFT